MHKLGLSILRWVNVTTTLSERVGYKIMCATWPQGAILEMQSKWEQGDGGGVGSLNWLFMKMPQPAVNWLKGKIIKCRSTFEGMSSKE